MMINDANYDDVDDDADYDDDDDDIDRDEHHPQVLLSSFLIGKVSKCITN